MEHSVKSLVEDLETLAAMLRPFSDLSDDQLGLEQAETLCTVYRRLHGEHDVDKPYDQRITALGDLVPNFKAWCVAKIYDPRGGFMAGEHSVWPGMAFHDRDEADRWGEFLNDYYRDTSKDRFVVEETFARPADMSKEGKPLGSGYGSDRNSWVGTLPMVKFKYTETGWRRVSPKGKK